MFWSSPFCVVELWGSANHTIWKQKVFQIKCFLILVWNTCKVLFYLCLDLHCVGPEDRERIHRTQWKRVWAENDHRMLPDLLTFGCLSADGCEETRQCWCKERGKGQGQGRQVRCCFWANLVGRSFSPLFTVKIMVSSLDHLWTGCCCLYFEEVLCDNHSFFM